MRRKSLSALGAVLFALSGCSIANQRQCRSWQNDGDFFASLDSCTKCLSQFGSGNKEAVKGCAMALDAGNLLQGMQNLQ